MVQDQKKRPTLDLDAEMGGATEIGPQPTGPSVGESNQDRLAELGMARPRGAAKAELQGATDAVPGRQTAASSLDGMGEGFRASSDYAGHALERQLSTQPALMHFLGGQEAVPKEIYGTEMSRYESLAIRADSLAAEDLATRVTHDEAMRHAAILDEVMGEDLDETASADTQALDDGLQSTGLTAPAQPSSGPALEQVRLRTADLGLATMEAKAAATELRAAALRRRATAKQDEVDEIEAYIEQVNGAIDTATMLFGWSQSMGKMPDFPAKSEGEDPEAGDLVDIGGSIAQAAVTVWMNEDLDDLRGQVAALTEGAEQLGLVGERTRLAVNVEKIGAFAASLDNARAAASAAVGADQQAWQEAGFLIDLESRLDGGLGKDEELAQGAGLRIAKIEEVGQRLEADRDALGPMAEKVDGFAAELKAFTSAGSGIEVLTHRRQAHQDDADRASSAAGTLRAKASATNERIVQVSAATAMVAAVRGRHAT
jgi:hypothetical protein